MRIVSVVGITIAALAAAMPATAAQFAFSFTPSQALLGATFSGSGIFTTSDVATMVGGQTAFAITSITGTVGGSAIVAPTAASYGNYFTTGSYFLDGSGVNFSTASGRPISFFNQSNNNLYRINAQSPGASFYVTATSSAVAAVPEPASWAMMIGGFGLTGAALRRRRGSFAARLA